MTLIRHIHNRVQENMIRIHIWKEISLTVVINYRYYFEHLFFCSLFIFDKEKFDIYFKQESVSVTFPANKYHADISKAESNISTELLITNDKNYYIPITFNVTLFKLRLKVCRRSPKSPRLLNAIASIISQYMMKPCQVHSGG